MHPIEIKAVLNGWKCRVGCQEVVFTDLNALLASLKDYLIDPIRVEKNWMETAINAKWTTRGGPEQIPQPLGAAMAYGQEAAPQTQPPENALGRRVG